MVRCIFDDTVLNAQTVYNLTNLGLSIFAVLCGKNRGVFVTDQQTYSCLSLPPSFQISANIPQDGLVSIESSNDIDLQLKGGNITGDEAIDLLEQLNEAVFDSSGPSSNAYDPYSCNLNGLSTYVDCPYDVAKTSSSFFQNIQTGSQSNHHHHDSKSEPSIAKSKIRGVTLAGLFLPAPWASGNSNGLLTYELSDFTDIANAGLNTVLIPISASDVDFWISKSIGGHHDHNHRTLTHTDRASSKGNENHKTKSGGHTSLKNKHTKKSSANMDKALTKKPDREYLIKVLDMAQKENLSVIVHLATTYPNTATIASIHDVLEHAIHLLQNYYPHVVVGIQLPTISNDIEYDYSAMISIVRKISKHLPIFIPTSIGQVSRLRVATDTNIYTALTMEHISSIADIASSSSLDDRMKMYYHENVACTQRTPIEYVACYKNSPALISSGFDLAIDNCAYKDDETAQFLDYGQCDRWNETVDSNWWDRHRLSFAIRQLASFEMGLGWIFASWKVSSDDSEPSGKIYSPAQLHSFKAVVSSALFPSLTTNKIGSNELNEMPACLNPPLDDFVLGDETLAPVPPPPPDCGNGWWNYTINDCSYWIPPPPPPPCPICDICNQTEEFNISSGSVNHHHSQTYPNKSTLNENVYATVESSELKGLSIIESNIDTNKSIRISYQIFMAGILVSFIILGILSISQRNRGGYVTIPN